MPDDKSEQYELSRIGAIPTKNSGRGAFSKGDGILEIDDEPVFTVDVKEYEKSYPMSLANLAKVSTDARKNQTQPLLQLVIGKDEPRQRWIAITENMFIELWEVYKENQ